MFNGVTLSVPYGAMRTDETKKLLKRLGERVREARKNAGLRQEDFEDGTSLSVAARSLQEIEYGSASPKVTTLYKIAKRCGVQVRDLIDF